jgi:hypothetical protein
MEAYVWPEGTVYLWTGTATASAIAAYAQNTQANMVHGWINRPALGGTYHNVLTGLRADVSVGMLYTYDATILKMFHPSATAVHIKLLHSGVNGTAGHFFYSGVIDSISIAGTEQNPYQYTLAYHANIWSAFGG